jgi:hypothetical protein
MGTAGPDRGVQGKYRHPAPESKFIRQNVRRLPSLSKMNINSSTSLDTIHGFESRSKQMLDATRRLREHVMRPQGTTQRGFREFAGV